MQSHQALIPPLATVTTQQAHKSVAALFDVDNTLLPGEASEIRFFKFLWRRGVVGWAELRRSAGWLVCHVPPFSLHALRERKIYLAGKRTTDIAVYAQEFCQTELLGKLSLQGRTRLEAHRQAGHALIFVTGAPDFLIEPLATFLGVPTVFAAKLAHQHSLYTGALIPPLPYGAGKRDLILAYAHRIGLDLAESYAYGDSPGDHDILALVGHPVVVNPIRGMRRTAHQQKWPVEQWA